MGEIGSVAMCRRIFKHQTTESGEIPFFKIGNFGGTPDAFISKDLFEDFKAKYPYPEKGAVLISASGSIGRTVVFTGKDEYFQDSNIVWLKHDNSITNSFLYHLYSIVRWVGIEGTTIKRLYNDNILKTEAIIPLVSEQQKISDYLDAVDHLITLHQSKSFKCFFVDVACCTLSWEQRKLGECFTERIESMPDGELISVTINDGVKKFSELGRHDNSNDDKSKYKKVCIGDIAYNSMRMWQGASGYSYYNGIVSPAYTVLSANYNVNSKFIAYQFKLPKMIHTFKINSQGITSDNWNLKFPVLSYIEIYISKQIEEQSKIAVFLESLDHLITLHQLEPYYLIFKAIAYRIIDYAEYKFFNVKINLIHDIL